MIQGALILITYQWWQLFSGMPEPLLENPQQQTRHLPNDWWLVLKVFLASTNGKLVVYNDVVPYPPSQDNDINLMQAANKHKQITTADLISFNQTRLYLQVMYLSEITTIDGSKFDKDSWNITHHKPSHLL